MAGEKDRQQHTELWAATAVKPPTAPSACRAAYEIALIPADSSARLPVVFARRQRSPKLQHPSQRGPGRPRLDPPRRQQPPRHAYAAQPLPGPTGSHFSRSRTGHAISPGHRQHCTNLTVCAESRSCRRSLMQRSGRQRPRFLLDMRSRSRPPLSRQPLPGEVACRWAPLPRGLKDQESDRKGVRCALDAFPGSSVAPLFDSPVLDPFAP